jgi:hypothetical protein
MSSELSAGHKHLVQEAPIEVVGPDGSSIRITWDPHSEAFDVTGVQRRGGQMSMSTNLAIRPRAANRVTLKAE